MPTNKNCQGLVFFRSKIILTNNFETIYHNAILIETCVLSRAVFPQQSKNLHQIIIRLQIEFLSLLFRWDFNCNWWFLSLFIAKKISIYQITVIKHYNCIDWRMKLGFYETLHVLIHPLSFWQRVVIVLKTANWSKCFYFCPWTFHWINNNAHCIQNT